MMVIAQMPISYYLYCACMASGSCNCKHQLKRLFLAFRVLTTCSNSWLVYSYYNLLLLSHLHWWKFYDFNNETMQQHLALCHLIFSEWLSTNIYVTFTYVAFCVFWSALCRILEVIRYNTTETSIWESVVVMCVCV